MYMVPGLWQNFNHKMALEIIQFSRQFPITVFLVPVQILTNKNTPGPNSEDHWHGVVSCHFTDQLYPLVQKDNI